MFNKTRKYLLAAAVASALGVPASASATLFTFDPTGTPGAAGDIAGVALLDQAPGTGLALNGGTAVNNKLTGVGPTTFTLHYQANLSSVQFADTSIAFGNGQGGHFFNFVAGFGENVINVTPFPGTATFAWDPANPVNYFQIWHSNAIANQLTGAGFGAGNLVLNAVVVAQNNSNFQVNPGDPVPLDNSPNGNQWGAQNTVTGAGSTDLVFQILNVDNNFFPDLNPGELISQLLFNNSQVTPFSQVDPSQNVANGAGGLIPVVGTLGATNGDLLPPLGAGGPNFVFQADGNASITVPEPGTVALLGLGLGFLGLGRSRRRAS